MNDINIFSVYVDKEIFHSFFRLNPNLWALNVCGIDNRKNNYGLSKIYNSIISDYIDRDTWLYFVHEDFEIKGDLQHLRSLPRDAVYGSFGVQLVNHAPVAYGTHVCSNKDGSNAVQVGLPVTGTIDVDSIDCQSILLHTSMLQRYPQLRFDENLSFDLYAEELCLQAKFRYQIPIRVFNLEFQHYSHGKIGDRYRNSLKYIAAKFPDNAIPGTCSFVGGAADKLEKFFQYNIQAGNV